MIIYLLKFPNKKHYVGRTQNSLQQRLTEHLTRATRKIQHPLYYAINKYGWDNVEKIQLYEAQTEKELIMKELEYIIQYDSFNNGYNLTLNTEIGGDNWKGRRDTPEYEAWKEHMSEAMKGAANGMYGKTHKESTKSKMKEKAKGRFSLPWYIEKNGREEGTQKYNDRCFKLKNRNLKKASNGRFIKRA